MARVFLTILAIMIITVMLWQPVMASDLVQVAVMDLDITGGLSETYQRPLSDRLRQELFKTGQFVVVDRGTMEEILSEQALQLAGCTTNDCVVEAGRVLGVEQMVAGSVARVGEIHTVNVRLIDVETSAVLAAESVDCHCPIEEVLTDRLREAATRLAISSQGDSEQAISDDLLVRDAAVRESSSPPPPMRKSDDDSGYNTVMSNIDDFSRDAFDFIEDFGITAFGLRTGVGGSFLDGGWLGGLNNGLMIHFDQWESFFYLRPAVEFTGGAVGATVDGQWTSLSIGGVRFKVYFFDDGRRATEGLYYGAGLGLYTVSRNGVDPQNSANTNWEGTYGHIGAQACVGAMFDINVDIAGRPFFWYAELDYDHIVTSNARPNGFLSLTFGLGLKLDTFRS